MSSGISAAKLPEACATICRSGAAPELPWPGSTMVASCTPNWSRRRSRVSVVPLVLVSALASCSDISRALLRRSESEASSVSRPRLRPAVSAVSTLTSNQDSMLRDTNW